MRVMRDKQQWPADKIARVLAMRQAGVRRRELAAHFGVSLGALDMKLYNLRRAGEAVAGNWRASDDDRLIELHGVRKLEWRAVARYFPGRSVTACRDRYHALTRQAQIIPGVRWSDNQNAELIARKDRGETFASIGIDLNRSAAACKVQYHALKRGAAAVPGAVVPTIRSSREALNERLHEVRAEPCRWASPFAEMLGEPPIGRSALDQRKSACGAGTGSATSSGPR